ncbi:MAG: AEC family transporter [Clostridiales bacterium]|nr:AEC family transporter [Clostridiales bacterium]
MNVPALIEKMLVLFFAMAAGFVCGKRGWLDDTANRTISRLVVMLTNPMLALSSVMGKERLMSNRQVLALTGISFALILSYMLLSRVVVRLLHAEDADRGLLRFLFSFCNISYIGYPVVQSLFGMDASFYVTVLVLCSQLIMWSYGIHLVSGHGKFRWQWSILKNHCLIASSTAYILYLTGLKVPNVLASACSFLGQTTSPLIMLITGSALALMPLKNVFTNVRLYAMYAIKLVVLPVCAYFLLRNVLSDGLLLGVIITFLCIPSATNATNIAYLYGGNHELASSGVMLSTLLSMFTLPALMQLLFG